MAHNDWVALVTEPAKEYLAQSELLRFGVNPYLPQCKRRWRQGPGLPFVERKYPLFPRYILLPFYDLDRRKVGSCQGICRARSILANADGTLWRAPNRVIEQIKTAEQAGNFDETLKIGDEVVLDVPVLLNIPHIIEKLDARTAHIVTPLLGGARLRVKRAAITKGAKTL